MDGHWQPKFRGERAEVQSNYNPMVGSNDVFYQSLRMEKENQEDFFITFIKNAVKSNLFQVLVLGDGAYLQERVNRST